MKFEVVENFTTKELVGHVLTRQNNDTALQFNSDLLKLVVSLEETLGVCGKLHILAEHMQHVVIFHVHPIF